MLIQNFLSIQLSSPLSLSLSLSLSFTISLGRLVPSKNYLTSLYSFLEWNWSYQSITQNTIFQNFNFESKTSNKQIVMPNINRSTDLFKNYIILVNFQFGRAGFQLFVAKSFFFFFFFNYSNFQYIDTHTNKKIKIKL